MAAATRLQGTFCSLVYKNIILCSGIIVETGFACFVVALFMVNNSGINKTDSQYLGEQRNASKSLALSP